MSPCPVPPTPAFCPMTTPPTRKEDQHVPLRVRAVVVTDALVRLGRSTQLVGRVVPGQRKQEGRVRPAGVLSATSTHACATRARHRLQYFLGGKSPGSDSTVRNRVLTYCVLPECASASPGCQAQAGVQSTCQLLVPKGCSSCRCPDAGCRVWCTVHRNSSWLLLSTYRGAARMSLLGWKQPWSLCWGSGFRKVLRPSRRLVCSPNCVMWMMLRSCGRRRERFATLQGLHEE